MPKIIIPDKICPHCGGVEWDVKRYSWGSSHYCSKRRNEMEAERRKWNKEHVNEVHKKWREGNIGKCKESQKKYRLKNRKAISSRMKAYVKLPHAIKRRRELTNLATKTLPDQRVKNMLIHQWGIKGIRNKDIPLELVELKREQLKLYRHVKEISNAANS